MQEIRTEVKTFRVERKCQQCKPGRMICIKPSIVDGKPRSKHICSNDDCQAIEWIPGDPYPRIEYSPATIMQRISGAADTAKQKLKNALDQLPGKKNQSVKPKSKNK